MSTEGSIPPDHDKDKKKKEEQKPGTGYTGVKPYKKKKVCSLNKVEGLEIKEVQQQQSMGSKISRVMMFYLAFMLLFGTCSRNKGQQPVNLTPPQQTIEQMMPGAVDIYNHRNLEYSSTTIFGQGGEQVSKDGQILGVVATGYELLDPTGREIIGYVAPGGLYNIEGEQIASVDQKGIFSDLYGRDLGMIKIVDKEAEKYNIVDMKDNNIVLHEFGAKEYVILNEKTTKDGKTTSKEATLEGLIDGYVPAKDRVNDRY